jgi:hypothetical protein
MQEIMPQVTIESKIHLIRGKKVMIDRDLAALYEVETRTLNQAVQRNLIRFPEDFMFQLSKEEFDNLKSQIVISNLGHGGRRYLPYAFTENGVAMLSSVLNSNTAVLVNIQIMRAFTRLRNLVADNSEIRKAIVNIEKRLNVHDRQIQIAFEALKSLLQPAPALPHKHYSPDGEKKMGFGREKK